jgi:hypothetical protein
LPCSNKEEKEEFMPSSEFGSKENKSKLEQEEDTEMVVAILQRTTVLAFHER